MRVAAVLAMCCVITSAWSAQPVLRLHGSTTVKGALDPKRTELESRIGGTLDLHPTASGAGLLALAGERADVAMISSPIEDIARRINERKPGTINPADYHAAPIGAVRLTFIVNPRNPVRDLSAGQLADLLTGRITNWRDVGGPDLPVLVVSLANASSLLDEQLLRGEAVTSRARRVPTANQIPPVVAQERVAIGIISTAHVRGPTSLVNTDANVRAPLFLVTKGDPDAIEQKLIEAARELLQDAG